MKAVITWTDKPATLPLSFDDLEPGEVFRFPVPRDTSNPAVYMKAEKQWGPRSARAVHLQTGVLYMFSPGREVVRLRCEVAVAEIK